MTQGILSSTYGTPVLLGLVSAAGLIGALLADGFMEWLAVAAVAAPLVVVAVMLNKGAQR